MRPTPFAQEVTKTVRQVCTELQLPYFRLGRQKMTYAYDKLVLVESKEAAAAYLTGISGNILLTTGGNTLSFYAENVPEFAERGWAEDSGYTGFPPPDGAVSGTLYLCQAALFAGGHGEAAAGTSDCCTGFQGQRQTRRCSRKNCSSKDHADSGGADHSTGGITLEDAKKILAKARKEKLPIVDKELPLKKDLSPLRILRNRSNILWLQRMSRDVFSAVLR